MNEGKRHYRYTIDIDELGYAQLMRLVMKYGTGAGEGASTAITTRLALAEAKIRIDDSGAETA